MAECRTKVQLPLGPEDTYRLPLLVRVRTSRLRGGPGGGCLPALCDRPLRLDLAHLVGVDAVDLRTLRALRQRGLRITGASPYIELLLERMDEPEK